MNTEKSWYYIINNSKSEACTFDELIELVRINTITRDTPIWHLGQENWVPAIETPLKDYINAFLPKTSPEKVTNIFAWLLAIIPLSVSFIFNVLDYSEYGTIVCIILNIVFILLDFYEFRKANLKIDIGMLLGAFFVPIYLFVRVFLTDKNMLMLLLGVHYSY